MSKNVADMSQTELRTHLRSMRRNGLIQFESAKAEAMFPKFVNGELGFKMEDLKAVAIMGQFPVAGMTLSETEHQSDGFGSEEVPSQPEPEGSPDPSSSSEAPPSPAPRATSARSGNGSMTREQLLQELLSGVSTDDVVRIVNEQLDSRIGDGLPERITIVGPAKTKKLEGVLHHKSFNDVCQCVGADLPVAIVGPAGTGKTEMAASIADALDLSFHATGKLENEHKLLGFRDGLGVIHSSQFREAFTNGGLFLFDEFDSSSSRAVTAFNAALSNGFCDFPDKTVKAHKDFRVIAASNTYWSGATREYVGRNPLDGATKDRFVFIDVDYDNKLEKMLASQYQDGVQIAERVQAVRKVIAKLKIRHIVSMRATISLAKLVNIGFTQARAERIAMWKDLGSDQVSKIEKELAA